MSFFDTSYSVIIPSRHGSFYSEWQNCLDQLNALSINYITRIFKINIFISSISQTEFRTRKEFITEAILKTFGNDCPAFGVLAIFPEEQFHATIEAGLVKLSGEDLYFRRYNDLPYSVLVKNKYKELWVNGIEVRSETADTENVSKEAFDLMHKILLKEDMTFDNIVRQWNYIGNILNAGQNNNELVQNYQVFNKVRFEYYHKYKLIPGYPAATGVGMNYRGIMIDLYAIEPTEEMQIISVGNPQQINPYHYDQIVLSDSLPSCKIEKHPPLFERAKLLARGGIWQLLVSGTASIIGQETTNSGSLLEQTRTTIDNIEKLVSHGNLRLYYPQFVDKTLVSYKRIRVYVKNISDVAMVKPLCTEYFGNIPSVYIQSHICRTNLLIEIEAELNSGKTD